MPGRVAAAADRVASAAADRVAAAADQVAAAAERRTTVRRALAGLLGSVVLTATTLTVITLAAPPGRGAAPEAAGLDPTELDVVTPEPDPPPTHQPFRPTGIAPAVSPPPGPPPDQPAGEFVGWAILDRETGDITGSETMSGVSTTASMIKAWIVADYLRRTAEAGDQPSETRLGELELIIRDSNNEYAQTLFQEVGARESIERLISICRLTDSRPYRNFWSNTQLSPRDTARMGACIADGHAAGPEWTEWLLDEMRLVRGVGDFGVRQAFPAEERPTIAIKNGWIDRDYDRNWHVNCLAIGETWTMGVMVRYPVRLGYEHGAQLCQSLAAEHLLPRP